MVQVFTKPLACDRLSPESISPVQGSDSTLQQGVKLGQWLPSSTIELCTCTNMFMGIGRHRKTNRERDSRLQNQKSVFYISLVVWL